MWVLSWNINCLTVGFGFASADVLSKWRCSYFVLRWLSRILKGTAAIIYALKVWIGGVGRQQIPVFVKNLTKRSSLENVDATWLTKKIS